MSDFEVRRDDLRRTRLAESEPTEPGDGEVQLHIDRFGLTANNVTYGVMGDALGYWAFYPGAGEGWGRVPVWGYADVVASRASGIEPGERFYGLLPMASHVTIAARAQGPGFTADDEHRRALPAIYNQYVRTPSDAPHADEALLLRPLFATSFLLEDFLRTNAHFGADTTVLSSASSKTAYGLAHLLRRAGGGRGIVGLTSPGNRAFVESLGVYDRVLTYDEVERELAGDTDLLVYVDMAGDAAVREAVHRTAHDRLRHDAIVGATHWAATAAADPGEPLPGPAPQFFFAPAHIERLTEELGPGGLQARIAEAWEGFVVQLAEGWLQVEHGDGPQALEATWLAFVDGRADPRSGHVLRLG